MRSFGTEGRRTVGPQIPASQEVYPSIIFKGGDIKGLEVINDGAFPAAAAPQAPLQQQPPMQQVRSKTHFSGRAFRTRRGHARPPCRLDDLPGGVRSARATRPRNSTQRPIAGKRVVLKKWRGGVFSIREINRRHRRLREPNPSVV